MKFLHLLSLCLCVALFVSSCSTDRKDKEKEPLKLEKSSFGDIRLWRNDKHASALSAFRNSCSRIVKRNPDDIFAEFSSDHVIRYSDLQKPCNVALNQKTYIYDNAQAREFFETYFTPWIVYAGNDRTGLFTGYYEPLLHGSLTRHGKYQTPLRRRPDDLVMVNLGIFSDELKGKRIAGRVNENGYLMPFETREEISGGKLHNEKDLPVIWVDDPVDAFFLHIQGSGRVQLDDGRIIRLGYDGQNGHDYYAIGRELVKNGEIKKENVSLQSIRKWLADNPYKAEDLMNLNKSYVFFRILDDKGAIGGEGVPLTPERSLAVDHGKIPYGLPIWLETEPPAIGEKPFTSLMIAQDTGGAIKGAVRGDVFWGHGKRAEYLAGQMKSQGRYWILLPKYAD